ncbi:TPA: NUDIX domain-containing protein [Candidatus Woesearchaeota archaeon]|nr:NUDIX hydrolase [archaeon]HIJ11277.1 NUDIX domain-containing protein [Candidatus Woesearchaeota archaeon]
MEFLNIVNEQDEVIGQAPVNEIYANEHPHRIVHVLIFNKEGKILLQQRSKTKSFLPGYWVTSAGGHVQAGESYEQGALREMEEEVGVHSELDKRWYDEYKILRDGKKIHKFLTTFHAQHNGPFNYNDEVGHVAFFSVNEIKQMIANGEKFHPEFLFLLKKYYFVSSSL